MPQHFDFEINWIKPCLPRLSIFRHFSLFKVMRRCPLKWVRSIVLLEWFVM